MKLQQCLPGSKPQQFRFYSNGMIVHNASGLCVSIEHHSDKVGALLDLWVLGFGATAHAIPVARAGRARAPCARLRGLAVAALPATHSKFPLVLPPPLPFPPVPRGSYECSGSSANMKWTVDGGTGQIRDDAFGKHCIAACPSRPAPGPPGPPSPPSPPGPPLDAPITVNGSSIGSRFDGVWAMSANGAARQLFEYPEPTRSELLDLFFSPGVGTRWQALKTEIGGDVESSYGSMSSYAHVPNRSEWSFERGVQWWLIKEGRKRNPTIPLYALSWGMPWWVGDGVTLSEGGAEYHVNYLLGAKQHHNITFDYIGIWNEAPWSKEYILLFRKALDAAGFESTAIVAPDGGTDVIDASVADPVLNDAIGAWGLHAHLLQRLPNQLGKPYYNSENDLVDGVLPMWGGANAPGINWPLAFLRNYIDANGTATMLCPAFHGWNQNLGRHNHGPAFFNDPWSGFYQLGAPFFTQAQFTQFTEVGWHFIDSASENRGCTTEKHSTIGSVCTLTFTALAAPDGSDFSLILVNTGDAAITLPVELTSTLAKFRGTPLQVWRSIETEYFARQADAVVPAATPLLLTVEPLSVTTVSSRPGAGWGANFSVPQRQRFPLPFAPAWAGQLVDRPCLALSPIYGAFEVAVAEDGAAVCRQATPHNPAGNAWTHRANGFPVALLPSGSNWANYVAAVTARVELGGGGDTFAVTLCGHVPIFAPAVCKPMDHSLGVCLSVMYSAADPAAPATWRLTEAQNQYHGVCTEFATLGNGTLPHATGARRASGVLPWHRLSLSFGGGAVAASIDGRVVMDGAATAMSAGVAAIGTMWNPGSFRNLSITPHPAHPVEPNSWLFDVLPSSTLRNDLTGWAGLVLNLTGYPSSAEVLRIAKLGRFKSANNSATHQLAVADAADGSWVVPPSAGASVDMASCVTDALGFCYSAALAAPVTLAAGRAYFIVSSERAGGDSFVQMNKSATGADYGSYRSGDTFMSYRLPTGAGASPLAAGNPLVPAKVLRVGDAGEWVITSGFPEVDTSYGPVNFVLG